MSQQDHHHQQQVPLGEALQWETPTSRPKRKSLLGRLAAVATPGSHHERIHDEEHHHPTTAAATTAAATTAAAPAPTKAGEAAVATETTTPPPTSGRSIRQRLDAILPPHRTYLGGRFSRRSLLLFIVLPLLLLLLVVLPLAIGLGVGLSGNKNNTPDRDDLPLPPPLSPGGAGGQTRYTGDLTFYAPGLGACGTVSGSNDAIASVSHLLYDAAATSANPNENPLCGRRIRITRDKSSVDVTVVDRCEGCAAADLDLSPAAFARLAPESAGRVEGTWIWI